MSQEPTDVRLGEPIGSEGNPASSLDVAQAMTSLVTAVVLSVVTSESPSAALDAINDPTTNRGRDVAEAQSTLAIYLESWLGESQKFLASTVVQGLSEPLMERLANTHESLHRQTKDL